jgi:hypothetical protein
MSVDAFFMSILSYTEFTFVTEVNGKCLCARTAHLWWGIRVIVTRSDWKYHITGQAHGAPTGPSIAPGVRAASATPTV